MLTKKAFSFCQLQVEIVRGRSLQVEVGREEDARWEGVPKGGGRQGEGGGRREGEGGGRR